MKEKTDKILTLVLLGISIIATVIAVLFASGSDPKHVLQGVQEIGNNFSGMFDIAFYLLVIMVGISLVAIVFFLLKRLIGKFKDEPGYLKKFLLLVGVVVVLLIVPYLLSSGTDVSNLMLNKYNVTTSASRLIGAACILVYIIIFGAVLAILVTEVMPKSSKKK
jgi:H+/Cl- antiporter ClcA